MQLCRTDPRPQDPALAAALEVDVASVVRWREARSVSPEQACRLTAARLARSFKKGQSEVAATFSDAARRYNEGLYRNDDGTISLGGKALALDAREPLVVADAKLGGITSTSWTVLGPERLGGRIRALAFDMADPLRIYAGAATGGIWLSKDAGFSWNPVYDFTASLSISSFAQVPSDRNTIYASTSEWSAGFTGAGILKSSNRGVTWTRLGTTNPAGDANWQFVQSIAVDPVNPKHLIAGTWCGLYRSVDTGGIWNKIFPMLSDGSCGVGQRVVFSPADPALIIAGMTGRAIGRSVTGGASFNRIQLGTKPVDNATGVVDVAVSASNPKIWYASVNENSGDVYRSDDSGATWPKRSNPKHLGNQGDYDNVIWVDPTNPDVVVVGGIDLYRTVDGGVKWTKISDWEFGYQSGGTALVSAHADQHVIVSAPGYNGTTNTTVFFGNDGGVYRNTDIKSADIVRDPVTGAIVRSTGWESLNTGMITTQFYGAQAKVYPAGLAVAGGLQDNSVNFLPAGGKAWKQPTTGDGTGAFFDIGDPTRLTMSTQFLGMNRYNLTTDSLEPICQNIREATTWCNVNNIEAVGFIAPFVVDPTNAERVLAGAASLWLSLNARSGSIPGWKIIKARSPALINGAPNVISALAQRADSPRVVFVGHENGEIYSTDDAYAATPAWTRRDFPSAKPMPTRRVERIVIDPAQPSRMFALYVGATTGNIWTSIDSGRTWNPLVATSLPPVPVFSLAVRPSDSNTLYAGTDVGLFVSTNGGASWSTTNHGPGGASVREVTFADTSTLVVATFGRGVWKTTVSATDNVYALTVSRGGTGSGTVVSSPAIFNCAPVCAANFIAGTSVSLQAVAAAGSYFAGWGGVCTGMGVCTVAMTADKTVGATFALGVPALTASPVSISYGGQSMQTTSPVQTITVSNASGSAIAISSVAVTTHFGGTHSCGTSLAAGASCTVSIAFTPTLEGAHAGVLTVTSSVGAQTVALSGIGEKSLVTHYYRSILRRAPDAGGKAYWDSEAARVQALGVNVNEVWFALAQQFYFSAEYAAQNRDATGYVTDLYSTFFNRVPDTAGRDYWVGLINQGLPREVVLLGYMFSSEFATFTQALFGAANTRKEMDTVVDFYRGLLARLPDEAGFNYWVGQFRTAQCSGAAAVTAQAEAISSAYANSGEYTARNRTNTQFVSDMYNAFLRRAGDLAGVQYWISQIATGARTRENVRQQFVASPEFSSRVQSVIAQGCLR